MIVITSRQIGTTIANPDHVHRTGNLYIPFLHSWLRLVVLLSGGSSDAYPRFTTVADSPMGALVLSKKGASEFTNLLREVCLISA